VEEGDELDCRQVLASLEDRMSCGCGSGMQNLWALHETVWELSKVLPFLGSWVTELGHLRWDGMPQSGRGSEVR
jgi:hypothetical protein